MKTIKYRTMDKSTWGPGPWQEEPDKVQWQDEASGLPCLIVRNSFGNWCGYVGVAPGHPWHGKDYNGLHLTPDDYGPDVHGGLTFADNCANMSHETWEKWRARVLAGADEAKQYPLGDAARRLRDRVKELADYEAFVAHSKATRVCHIPDDGEPDNVWWLGFDCGHCDDFSPGMDSDYRHEDSQYRDMAYVQAECAGLARQIAAVSDGK
jgi:hypothetical protein